MKKYLVSKDVVDAFLDGSWDGLEDFRSDDSWGSDEIVGLPPGAVVLTREEVAHLLYLSTQGASHHEILTRVFGESP